MIEEGRSGMASGLVAPDLRTDELGIAEALELLILGAGPAYSDEPGALGSAYLVRSGDHALVLDLGQGTFPRLAAALEPSRLAAVMISHLHPDHFIDLIPLRHYLCRAEFERPRRVRVLSPAGLDDRLDGAYGQLGFADGAFDLEQIAAGELAIGPFIVEIRAVRHSGESYACRVSLDGRDGPGIVYSGDCSDPHDVRPLVRPGDALLCEATFGPGPVPVGMPHLDGPAVGRLAQETGAGQLFITHVRMGCDPVRTMAAVRDNFGGLARLVHPGDRFEV